MWIFKAGAEKTTFKYSQCEESANQNKAYQGTPTVKHKNNPVVEHKVEAKLRPHKFWNLLMNLR